LFEIIGDCGDEYRWFYDICTSLTFWILIWVVGQKWFF
jgi:hypothetical protein